MTKIYERPAAQKAVTIPMKGPAAKFLGSKEEVDNALKSGREKILAAEQNDSAK